MGDAVAVEAGAAALADFGGAFHVVVHNATYGPPGGGRMPDIRTDQWRGEFAVNLDAAFFLTRALLRRDGALPPGSSVVFIGSGRGHWPSAGHAAYGTAKAGLVHFAAMLAQDVGPRGIRVNVVSPGFTRTATTGASEEEIRAVVERTALRRWSLPEDVAGAVLFFASDLSAFVTASGCASMAGISRRRPPGLPVRRWNTHKKAGINVGVGFAPMHSWRARGGCIGSVSTRRLFSQPLRDHMTYSSAFADALRKLTATPARSAQFNGQEL